MFVFFDLLNVLHTLCARLWVGGGGQAVTVSWIKFGLNPHSVSLGTSGMTFSLSEYQFPPV